MSFPTLRVLGLVPARGGSKGVPRKNVRAPAGRPLLQYTADLSTDAAPMLPVVQHALRWFDNHGRSFDAVCLLQPTAPLRRPADIDRCIDLLAESSAD